MIEPTHQEILTRLARLSELAPDMRFGQLIANLAFMAAGPWNQTLWDLEDAPLFGAVRQMESDLTQRLAYQQMAREEAREREALEWAEATVGETIDETR